MRHCRKRRHFIWRLRNDKLYYKKGRPDTALVSYISREKARLLNKTALVCKQTAREMVTFTTEKESATAWTNRIYSDRLPKQI